MEKVRYRIRLKFIKKYEHKKYMKQQSKLPFNRIHKIFENCDKYSFKKNEVKVEKPI